MAALDGAAGLAERARRRVIARDAATFERFALVLLIVMFLNIASGAFVRLTGSGLGCPDWPRMQRPARPAARLPPGDRVLEPHDRALRHPGRAADVPLGAQAGRSHGAPALGRRGAAHVRADPARRDHGAVRPAPAARDDPLPRRHRRHRARSRAVRALLGRCGRRRLRARWPGSRGAACSWPSG